MSIGVTLAVCALIAVLAKTVAWILQSFTGNAGIVDAIWAFTLGSLALVCAAAGDAPVEARVAVALMGGLWGLRLGVHLWRRNWGAPVEDFRYAALRRRWGANENRNLFWFFQFQNLFTLLLAASAFLPASYADRNAEPWALAVAVTVWLVAVIGESIADEQMAAFRANPVNKNRVCRDGLWRWSRHPNYFFECLHWLAYLPLALLAPYGWVALAAPLIMAFLLLRLSGVPLLEAELSKRKSGYAEYIRTTRVLVPFPLRVSK